MKRIHQYIYHRIICSSWELEATCVSVTQRKKKCLDKQHAVIQQTEVTDRCIDYNKKEYQKHPSSLKRN